MKNKIKLLTDGKEAFPEILKCIDEAERSIDINMFIWREDNIGKTIAEALLKAADRGVVVDISVDRYGFVLEKCEECTHSFFHSKPTLSEAIKIFALKTCYPTLAMKNPPEADHLNLLKKMSDHKNIHISADVFKADHSKYYVFDEKILILGGINIEDKENGRDISGRRYQDYMVKISDEKTVENFRLKMRNGIDSDSEIKFTANNKNISPMQFEAENTLLEIINGAKTELLIIMAYFSPLPQFIKAIHEAWKRGVKITVVIPEHANFQDSLNRKTVKKLMKLCNNGIELRFFNGMVHTKLIQNEKVLTFGSCNITKKAFGQLAELNLTVTRSDEDFFNSMNVSIEKTLSECTKIPDGKAIKFNAIMAAVEGFLV